MSERAVEGNGGARRVAPLRAGSAFALLFEAIGLLRRRRDLWGLASVPLAFSTVLVSAALGLLVANATDVHAFLTAWMPVLEATHWYQWIWIGPVQLVLWVLGALSFALAAAVSVIAAGLVASIAAAPLLDALSQRVERIEKGGAVPEAAVAPGGIVGEVGRTIANEAQRVGLFGALWAVIFVLGVFVPGGQLVAPVALAALTIFFLPLDYAGHLLDRQQVPFSVRRRWLFSNKGATVGFGSAAFLTCLVPGLNFVLLPALVTAGTLFALRHPPATGGEDLRGA